MDVPAKGAAEGEKIINEIMYMQWFGIDRFQARVSNVAVMLKMAVIVVSRQHIHGAD